MSEREEMVSIARSLDRGYTFGTAGNVSVRLQDRVIVTPTNSSFSSLSAEMLSDVDLAGNHVDGPNPSKEAPFHLAVYRARPEACAVVHLHSCFASSRADLSSAAFRARSRPALSNAVGILVRGRIL